MAKLHEILAVESDLESTAKKVMDEATVTFTKRMDHFIEVLRETKMFAEARQNENTSEYKKMVTTVDEKLAYLWGHLIKYYDVVAQKERTNQNAKADIVVDNVTLAKDVPATLLLGFETKLKQLRSVYEHIPTLQPGKDWEEDPERGAGVWHVRGEDKRFKTEKAMRFQVLYQHTDKHPAQVDKWTVDEPVAAILMHEWSGMLSPARKSELLGRIDTLIQAVKAARQRANTTEVEQIKIGKVLHDFIHG